MFALFNYLNSKLEYLALKYNAFYKLSIWLFIFQISFGCIYLIMLTYVKDFKKLKVKGVYYLYQTCFFIDCFLCFAQNAYLKPTQGDFAVLYFICLIKFMLLIALYGLICAQKWVLCASEKNDVLLKENSLKPFFIKGVSGESVKKQSKQLEDFQDILPFDKKIELADVNVSYLLGVIDCLKGKNITDSEQKSLAELEYILRSPIECENEKIRALNEKLEFLVKKITEYKIVL